MKQGRCVFIFILSIIMKAPLNLIRRGIMCLYGFLLDKDKSRAANK